MSDIKSNYRYVAVHSTCIPDAWREAVHTSLGPIGISRFDTALEKHIGHQVCVKPSHIKEPRMLLVHYCTITL